MDEYIKRGVAMDSLEGELKYRRGTLDYNAGLIKAKCNLEAIPAADVRPVVRGKWIKYAPHNSDMMTCSVCEKYLLLDGDQYDYHFCPICGALMEEHKE